MDNRLDRLMESIFTDLNFSLAKKNINKYIEMSENMYIAHKENSDYFIYINLKVAQLNLVTNDIQIKLSSILKQGCSLFDKLNGETIEISPSFEKNTTLIIFTQTEDETNKDELVKQIISIEEDPYFFKKHVVDISSNHIDILYNGFLENERGYTTSLQNLISDTKLFNEFMVSTKNNLSDKVIEYSFAAKLYEKLPFLTLSVKSSDPEDLQKSIDDSLSEHQREQCEILLNLNLNDLTSWFDDIVKEKTDD
ncbi:ABC-three component system middle component 1 [Enterovibrio norvegicus]|uniref:ABC-three component system middle component 1 n=1 Tax=Enterovibrio norvegicus TaxID=188144 RepID=UPI00354F52C0